MIIRLVLLCIITAMLPVDKATSEMLIASFVAIGTTAATIIVDSIIRMSDRAKLLLFLFFVTGGMQYFAPVLSLWMGTTYLPMWQGAIMMPMLPALLMLWVHAVRHRCAVDAVQLTPPPAVTVTTPENSKTNEYYEIPSLYAISAKRILAQLG